VTESRKRFGGNVHNCGVNQSVSALVSLNRQSSTRFAFKLPLTMRMLQTRLCWQIGYRY
jgi:hypothetical protein